MQNTLEQLAWFAACLLPLATWLPTPQLGLVPVACGYFAPARFVYGWGYLRSGTLDRAPGVQMSFMLNVALYAHALALFVRQGLA